MFSVTSEAATSVSFQTAPAKPARYDQSQRNDSFGALVDSSAPADTGNDRSTSTAQQQPASQRRADDAAASADNAGSRNTPSADQAATNASDNRNAGAKQASDANTAGTSDTNTEAVQRSRAKSGASKIGTVKTTEKPASDTIAATDPSVATASAQHDGPSVTTPNPVAVAIPVPVAPTDVPAATPTSGTGTAPLALAAAAIAASTPATTGPVVPPAPVKIDFSAAGAATAPATDSAPAVAAATADATANAAAATATAKIAVQPTATPADATAATDAALTETVAATAPVAPKSTLLKTPAAPQAKTMASGTSDTNPGTSDPSLPATPAQNNAAQQPAAAAKQQAGNDIVDTARTDASGNSSSASAPTPSARDHSPLNATTHALADSPDAGVQGTTTLQPPLATAAAPAGPQSVTAATGAPVPLSGLAVEIAASARSGKSRFEIRLDPADLGRIDVRIDVDRDGRVTSHLTVEKPETLSMLRQDAPQLQRALDDAGFKTGDSGLQFSLRDQSSSGQNNGNETSRNAQRLVISEDDTIPAAVAGRTYGRVLGSSSGVDIRV